MNFTNKCWEAPSACKGWVNFAGWVRDVYLGGVAPSASPRPISTDLTVNGPVTLTVRLAEWDPAETLSRYTPMERIYYN